MITITQESIHQTALNVVLTDQDMPAFLRKRLELTNDAEGVDQCLRIHWKYCTIEKRAMVENAMMFYVYTSERLKQFN